MANSDEIKAEADKNPSVFKRIVNKAAKKLDKVVDKLAADQKADPDDLKPKKNYQTKEYWEGRKTLPVAELKDKGIDR